MQSASVGLRKDGLHCLDPPDVADRTETANANLFYLFVFPGTLLSTHSPKTCI